MKKLPKMTDEQFKTWLDTDEGGVWLANELKKKLYEYEELKKLSRLRNPKYLKS